MTRERDWRGKEGGKGRERRAGGFFQPAASAERGGRTRELRGREQLEIPLREGGSSRSSFLLSLSPTLCLQSKVFLLSLPPSLARSYSLAYRSLLHSAQLSSVTLVRSLARTSVLFPPKTRLQLCCMRQFSAPLPPSFLLTQLLSAVTEKGKVSCDM